MRETIGALAIYGILCGWIQIAAPPGKMKKSVTFALGVLLLATILQSMSGLMHTAVRNVLRQTRPQAAAYAYSDVQQSGLGAFYAREAVRSIAGREADCTVTFGADGMPARIAVSIGSDADADLLSQAMQNASAEQMRERIIQTLCGIYEIRPDAIVFL